MILISIIIPVYNAEKHLQQCVQLLLDQTLRQCEFIFINDGSSDESQSIIENFQKLDDRIILINQKNQGVSAARNKGLEIATGNCIGFVDADDTFKIDLFQNLYETALASKADIVCSKFIIQNNTSELLSTSFFPENTLLDSEYIKKEIIPYMIKAEGINVVWNKLYTKKLIKDNHITFPVGVSLGEDGLFNINAFQHSNSAYFTDYCGYFYKEIEGSATRNFLSKDYFAQILQEYQYDYSKYTNSDLDENKIQKLKEEKLLTKTVSLVNEITNPKNNITFKNGYNYIKKIVNNTVFQTIITENYQDLKSKKGTYEQFILRALKNKWIYLLFFATAYSRYRNK